MTIHRHLWALSLHNTLLRERACTTTQQTTDQGTQCQRKLRAAFRIVHRNDMLLLLGDRSSLNLACDSNQNPFRCGIARLERNQ